MMGSFVGRGNQYTVGQGSVQGGGGLGGGGDGDSLGTAIRQYSIAFHLKLTSTTILKELYSIEKCAICLDAFLRF